MTCNYQAARRRAPVWVAKAAIAQDEREEEERAINWRTGAHLNSSSAPHLLVQPAWARPRRHVPRRRDRTLACARRAISDLIQTTAMRAPSFSASMGT
jgi:hypothetical protein